MPPQRPSVDWSLVKLTIGYLCADYLARSVAALIGFRGEHALIIGAVVSLILAIVVLQQFPSLRAEIGLTGKQKPDSVIFCISGVLFLTAVGVVVGVLIPRAVPSFEMIVHKVVLSSASEELVYRGIALAMLARAIAPCGMLWPLLITSICFSLIHAPFIEGGTSMDFVRFGYGAMMGLVLGAMRIKSGSLLFPIIGHMAVNGSINLVALLFWG